MHAGRTAAMRPRAAGSRQEPPGLLAPAQHSGTAREARLGPGSVSWAEKVEGGRPRRENLTPERWAPNSEPGHSAGRRCPTEPDARGEVLLCALANEHASCR